MEKVPEEIIGLSRAVNGHWWMGTMTSGYHEDATDHHVLTEQI